MKPECAGTPWSERVGAGLPGHRGRAGVGGTYSVCGVCGLGWESKRHLPAGWPWAVTSVSDAQRPPLLWLSIIIKQ